MLLLSNASKVEAFTVGKLNVYSRPSECGDDTQNEDPGLGGQRYWYDRIPPFVGFSNGEQTHAGGDGTCIIGFPDPDKTSALISVNENKTPLILVTTENNSLMKYESADHTIKVEIHITGSDSTCSDDIGGCCGIYTYALIKVFYLNEVVEINAARYVGG